MWLVAAMVTIPGAASAATFEAGELYSLSGNETVEGNLYIGAGDLTVSGDVQGDLAVAGGAVVVSGAVRDDLAAAGGDVSLLGTTGGDARIAGGNVLVDAEIGGDLLVLGGSMKVLDDVTVAGDMTIAGGYVMYRGVTTGDARIMGDEIVLNGTISGDVAVDVGTKLTIGENANIAGLLVYRGAHEDMVTMHASATVGALVYEPQATPHMDRDEVKQGIAAVVGTLFVMYTLAVALAAIVVVLVFKRFSQAVVQTTHNAFWMNVLRGFIFFVVVPVALLILFMTVFGIHLALVLLFAYILVLFIADLYAGVIAGTRLVQWLKKDNDLPVRWWHALLGIVLLSLVTLVPVIGWLVTCLFFLVALGVLFELFRTRTWETR